MEHLCANAVKSLIQGRAYLRVCSILFKFVKSAQSLHVPDFFTKHYDWECPGAVAIFENTLITKAF